MHEFETTHLKSRGGSGTAGVFMEESAFLNPASISFFEGMNIYAQRDMLKFKDKDNAVTDEPKNTGFVVSEANSGISGTLSYVEQNEEAVKRKRWGVSASTKLDARTSLGLSVRKTKDHDSASNSDKKYYQTVIGLTSIIANDTSLGFVVYDAFKSQGQATKALVGFQHSFADYITVSGDVGANWHADEISDSLLYKGAVQLRVWNDFFLRFGAFDDKELEEKGNGFGLSWIQPKLGLEFAMKNTKKKENLALSRPESKIQETSFALSLRF